MNSHSSDSEWTYILFLVCYRNKNKYYCVNSAIICKFRNIRRRVIGISGSLAWSKTLMELIFNPCGEFGWSPDGPFSQIHFPHLHVGAPGILSDLLMSVQILEREWGAESNRKLPHLFIPSKTATLVPEFALKTWLWAELPGCLGLQWKTCPWAKTMMMILWTK